MIAESARKLLNFEEYLNYDDATDNRYELIEGELAYMSTPTVKHILIAEFTQDTLKQEIKRLNLPWLCLREVGIRTGFRKARLPDVCVVTIAQANELMNKSAVFEMPPILAVEVVSDSSITQDYRYKRSEYATADIQEYWIVDPLKNQVSILTLEDGFYESREFTGEQVIVSKVFIDLVVSAQQLLS